MVLTADPLPLAADTDGVIRIANTRVTLDTLVGAFRDGLTAEAMVEQYPSLRLQDVYAVIGYYLSHQTDVDAYLASREQHASHVRQKNEERTSPVGIRSRLVARKAQQE